MIMLMSQVSNLKCAYNNIWVLAQFNRMPRKKIYKTFALYSITFPMQFSTTFLFHIFNDFFC